MLSKFFACAYDLSRPRVNLPGVISFQLSASPREFYSILLLALSRLYFNKMSSPSPGKRRMDTDVVKLIESKHEVTILGGLNEFVVRFYGPADTAYEGLYSHLPIRQVTYSSQQSSPLKRCGHVKLHRETHITNFSPKFCFHDNFVVRNHNWRLLGFYIFVLFLLFRLN